MKILFLTVGDETVASTRVRVGGYLPFLRKSGMETSLLTFTSRGKSKRILNLIQDTPSQRIFEIFYKIYVISMLFILAKRHHVVFVQKVILPGKIWNLLLGINKRVVFDFDDAIHLSRDITYLLSGAFSVIASNEKLTDYAKKYNKNVFKLISPVDVSRTPPEKENNFVTIGWVGSPETSEYLRPLLPVVKDLRDRFKNLHVEFMGAGDNPDFESLGIMNRRWSIEGQNKYLDEIDIGIMPLRDDEWSSAKAGYKLLLYMSRAIPCVASPVGVNTGFIKDGENGYLAASPKEWYDKLSVMIEDRPLRKKMGERGREMAEKYYSYEVCGPIMLDIIKGMIREKKG